MTDTPGPSTIGGSGSNSNVDAERQAQAQAHVGHVAVKLTKFWPDKASLWFVMAEAQFNLGHVTREQTKFSHVVTMLDTTTAKQVLDILTNPPDNPYTVLKDRLTKANTITKSEKASRIIDMDGLGDRTPSQCMAVLLNLVPAGEEPGFLLQELFLRLLPSDTRAHLADSSHTDTDRATLRKLALQADKHFSSIGARISAVQCEVLGPPAPTVDAVSTSTSGRSTATSTSVSGGQQTCFYHAMFGVNAERCQQPCKWKKPTPRGNRSRRGNSQPGQWNQGNSQPGQRFSN